MTLWNFPNFSTRAIFGILSWWFSLAAQAPVMFPDACTAEFIRHISADSIQKHILNLSRANRHYSRVSFTPGNQWAAEYIHRYFSRLPGFSRVEYDTFYVSFVSSPYDTIPLVNIVATFPGVQNTSHYLVLGGHYDATANQDPEYHWETEWSQAMAPGSDDNASGIAALLEIARVMTLHQEHQPHWITMKFIAFGAEERHPMYDDFNHFGSRRFVWNAFNRGDSILGALILDMIGYNDTDTVHVGIVANQASVELGRTAVQAKHRYQIGIHTDTEPFPEGRYSDHASFWIYGYKAVLFIENAPPWQDNPPWYRTNPYYHQNDDTPDKIRLVQVQRVARLALATALELCRKEVTRLQAPISPHSPTDDLRLSAFPNPFNAYTRITFFVGKPSRIRIQIFDLQGKTIDTLYQGLVKAGDHTIVWDGTDRFGRRVVSGIYICTLQTPTSISAYKLLQIR